MPSTHRLWPGLPGYLIPFATLAFVPQRQIQPREPFSPLVFFLISTHFTATPGIPFSSAVLKIYSFKCTLLVEPVPFTFDLHIRLRTLYAQ